MKKRFLHSVAFRLFLMLCASAALHQMAAAEGTRPFGSTTGDGSTVFTGLAQAPEANLFAGAAVTEIPILVPPGRQGLMPKLALQYSSSAGPGPYGYGWDLPLGRIHRSTKEGAIRCGAEHNRFVLSLPSATIECELDAAGRCRARVEESFLRIDFDSSRNSWEVWDKSGVRYVFGDEQMARQPVFPRPGCSTFAWNLTHVEDLNGNYLHVAYDGSQNSHYRYPQQIVYGGNLRSGLPPPFDVRFVWREPQMCPDGRPSSRPCEDRIINAMSGFPVELDRLLDRIEVRAGDAVVRSYLFQYDVDESRTARNGRQSFLYAVTLLDGANRALSRTDGAPASTSFLYHQVDTAKFGFGSAQSATRPPVESPSIGRWTERGAKDSKTRREIFDINGDAIPDLVEVPATCRGPAALHWKVYPGRPWGFADTPLEWSVERPFVELGLACPSIRQERSNAGGNVWSTIDTIDLTGDAIPDLVVTSTWRPGYPYWRVFPGRTPEGGGAWGFGPGIDWLAPFPEFRWSQSNLSYAGWDGTGDIRDLIDMNGDGLADLVQADPLPWRVWYNTGDGFEAGNGTIFDTSWSLLRFTTEFGLQIAGIADLNGDSLPDQIHTWEHFGGAGYTGAWLVRINTGSGVTSPTNWPVASSNCSWPTKHPWNGLRQTMWDGTDVFRDFFDINGDGLPDIVEACNTSPSNPYWTVWLNRGGGFAPARPWWSPLDRIRDVDDHVTLGGGKTFADTFDIDGDGLVDFVDFGDVAGKLRIWRNASGAWCASSDGAVCMGGTSRIAANPKGNRADLLVQMENGLGGSIYLEYRPSTQWDNTDPHGASHLPWVQWTLTRIERDDGLCTGRDSPACGVDSGAHQVVTEIDYAYGLFSPWAREFRGFRSVRERDPQGNVQLSFFHQDAVRKGKQEAVSRFRGSDLLLAHRSYGWQCVDLKSSSCGSGPSSCEPVVCPSELEPNDRQWVRLGVDLHYDTTAGTVRKVTGVTNQAWDDYGNVTSTLRGGSETTPVETRVLFAYANTQGRYQVDRAVSTEIVESPGTSAEKRLAATWYTYDDRGNVLTTARWLDQVVDPALPRGGPCPAPGNCVRTNMRYDIFGNVVSVTDANGGTTLTTYDAATRTYPISVENPLGQIVRSTWDPGCGTLLTKSVLHWSGDPAGVAPVYTNTYDTFCRLLSVQRPGESPRRPQTRYEHRLGSTGQTSALLTISLVSNTHTTSRVDLYDALGRRVQTQRDAVVDGKRRVVVEATHQFDERGRIKRTYAPFVVMRSNGSFVPASRGGGVTENEYDPLDRVIQIRRPDGSLRQTQYDVAWQSRVLDTCTVTRNCPGSTVIERQDAFGRSIETTTWADGRFGGAIRRSYDGLDRLRSVQQASAPGIWDERTRAQMVHDSLGRRIRIDDPDSGSWRYGYDLSGNLVFVDDPAKGRHIRYCFDAAGRQTDKHYGEGDAYIADCSSGGDVAYTYDFYDTASGFGDGYDWRTAVGRLTQVDDESGHTAIFYDTLGRTRLQAMSILPADAAPATGTIQFDYDGADHVTAITYPDGEKVKYLFDPVGQVRAVRGAKPYVRRMTYDVLGRPRALLHGNGTIDSWAYGGASVDFRLMVSDTKRGATTLARQVYTHYNANGLLDEIEDTGPMARYPELDRSARMEYDGLGRLTRHTTNGQAAEHFVYDLLGNLTSNTSFELEYDSAYPHRAARIRGNARHLRYDENGNRTTGPGSDFAYNRENRLESINGGQIRFLYNHAGQRAAMKREGEWTRYFGGLAELQGDDLTKYYFAGPLLVASHRVTGVGLAGRSAPNNSLLASFRRRFEITPANARFGGAAFMVVAAVFLWSLPLGRRSRAGKSIRRGQALFLICLWFTATMPDLSCTATAVAQSPAGRQIRHFHLDHLGSTHMITDAAGAVSAHMRYAPYGALLGVFDASGRRLSKICGGELSCRGFTGYDTEPISGLQYAGSRFYDPQLAQFLTPDPMRQFANPYGYAGWNPTNQTDRNGEAVVELLIGAIVAAALSAAVNTIVAAANGASLAQIGKAAAAGAVTGAVSVGIGVIVSGVSISLASAASTLPQNVGLQQALTALGDVAYRSAASAVVANILTQATGAAGLPKGAVIASGVIGGLVGGWFYDSYLLDYSKGLEAALPEMGVHRLSNTVSHRGLTRIAAETAGYSPAEADEIVSSNLAQDGPFLGVQHLNNQTHFGVGAARTFEQLNVQAGLAPLSRIGAASHYLQDPHALGHIFPGTHLFSGPVGAPVRLLIHQTVGGEVNFIRMAGSARIPTSFDATLNYFRSVRAQAVRWM